MDRIFLAIIRLFALVVSALALIGAVVLASLAVPRHFGWNDVQPSRVQVRYQTYRDELHARFTPAQQPSPKPTTAAPAAPAATPSSTDTPFAAPLEELFQRAVRNLTRYAKELDQDSVDQTRFRAFIRERMSLASATENHNFLEGLASLTDDLVADIPRANQLPESSPERAAWTEAVFWFVETAEQEQAAARERAETVNSTRHAEAKLWSYGAGVLLGLFLVFTIILTLLKIELNTRPAVAVGSPPKTDRPAA